MVSRSLLRDLLRVALLTAVFLFCAHLSLLASPIEVSGGVAGEEGYASTDSLSVSTLETLELTPTAYLPLVFGFYPDILPRSSRLGYCATRGSLMQYPDIRELSAGWYVNFGVREEPDRPAGIEHVQTVRLHQLTTCWPERTRDREACPYVTPYAYTLVSPSSEAAIAAIAEANPGALWLIGNEVDRRDWEGDGQDEMMPGLYARAYHNLYGVIKGADPTAQVAIGGIIQATPARLWYLTEIWDAYASLYGTNMPVDVWNVHNFIFKERCDDYGADIPPGCPPEICSENNGEPCYGTIYADEDHNSMQIFDQQIRAFRQWMKAHGQRNKPLIVSEYGIVYWHAGMEDPMLVQDFMLDTFDYFMNTKDCNLGYAADDCRLVQRWAWYSLDDDSPSINQYSYLFDSETLEMTSLGEAFAAYAQNHLDE